MEPARPHPTPVPICGRSGPIKPAAEPAAEPVTAENLSREIEQAFDDLPVQLPPSVRSKLSARLLKKGLHPSSEGGVEIAKTTCAQYLSKKERARAASAARRAAKKEAAKQEEDEAVAEQSETPTP